MGEEAVRAEGRGAAGPEHAEWGARAARDVGSRTRSFCTGPSHCARDLKDPVLTPAVLLWMYSVVFPPPLSSVKAGAMSG